MKKYGDYGGELLLPQKKSRKAVKVGDIFTIRLSTGDYYFGRVISDKGDQYPPTGDYFYIVYLYDASSTSPTEIPKLDKNHLLIPPYFTIKNDWSTGYLETVAHLKLEKDDVLENHYFYNPIFKVYNDGFGAETPKPTSKNVAIGEDGLASRMLIDQKIRQALGLELPDWMLDE